MNRLKRLTAGLNQMKPHRNDPPAGASPLCPHCDAAIDEIYAKQVPGSFGITLLHFCTACHKVLGSAAQRWS